MEPSKVTGEKMKNRVREVKEKQEGRVWMSAAKMESSLARGKRERGPGH